jgi:hypothetical protein
VRLSRGLYIFLTGECRCTSAHWGGFRESNPPNAVANIKSSDGRSETPGSFYPGRAPARGWIEDRAGFMSVLNVMMSPLLLAFLLRKLVGVGEVDGCRVSYLPLE